VAVAFKTSTLLSFHRALVQRKYQLLFSPRRRTKPRPKGPAADLIRAVVEMKRRNPTWGCPQIADQINLAFGILLIKMSFGGFSPSTTDRNPVPTVPHG
jgi:putative transposase